MDFSSDKKDHKAELPAPAEGMGPHKTPEGYVGREKVTPYMVRHLRELQVRLVRT
jgi:hypothetical protein